MLKGDLAPDFRCRPTPARVDAVEFSRQEGGGLLLPQGQHAGLHQKACSFRDDYAQFTALGAVVGISLTRPHRMPSSGSSSTCPFTWLATRPCRGYYGAWGEKVRCGRTYEGINRSTFVVGEDGRLLKVFANVKPEGHAQEVLAHLQ